MYVTVVVFGAGVLHHAPSRCHIHVVPRFISNILFPKSAGGRLDKVCG
jgi:hypothetical protein